MTAQISPQIPTVVNTISLFVYDNVVVMESWGVWLPLGLLVAHTKNGGDTYIPIAEYRHLVGDDECTDESLAKRLVSEDGYAGAEVLYVSYHYVPTADSEQRRHRMFEMLFEETLKVWKPPPQEKGTRNN